MKSPFNLTKQIPITTQSQRNPFLSPFLSLRNPFLSVQNELERAMNDFYNLSEPLSFPVEKFEDLRIYPSIDVVDNEKSFKVEVELPGMDEENIKVSINNGVLNIKGRRFTSEVQHRAHGVIE